MKKLLIVSIAILVSQFSNGQNSRAYKAKGPHDGLVFIASPTANVEIKKTPSGASIFLLDKNDAEYKSTSTVEAEVMVGFENKEPLKLNLTAVNGNEFIVTPKVESPIIYYVVTFKDNDKLIHARFVASDIK